MRMIRTGRVALIVCAALPLLAGCSGEGGGAMVACEQFVDRRVGATLEHLSPMDGATVAGDGPYVVRSAFTAPGTRRRTAYVCTVERGEQEWRLLDLVTDR